MGFNELVSPTLTELFVNEVERMILSSELKIGQKLPPERELAGNMKVSLAVINGGITRLSARGFLRVVPRKGVFVADYVREGNIDTLAAILEYTGGTYRPDMFEPIINFRKACDVVLVKDACQNRTEDQLEEMAALVEEMAACGDLNQLCEIEYNFQHLVAVASGNIVYPLIASTFKVVYITAYRALHPLSNKSQRLDNLRYIIQCIHNRDEARAAARMAENIEQGRQLLMENYSPGQAIQ